jgi:aspartate-semialdehyde dehydrogenase
MKEFKVGVLGATGAVGQEMMKILAERDFPVSELRPLASAHSAGKVIKFRGRDVVIQEAKAEAFAGLDIVFGAAENDIAEHFAPAIKAAGCVFIDNSSAFRLDPDVPLVVPEINPEDVKKQHGIIANPNCVTVIACTAINALNAISPIKSIVASSYQAVSGAGAGGPKELMAEVDALGKGEEYQPKVFQYQIAYNVIPQIGGEQYLGYTSEEMKLLNEGRKIMHLPDLKVDCTCVRVPVIRSHSVSMVVRTEKKISVEAARKAIAAAPRREAGGRSGQQAVPHAAGYQQSGSGVRGPYPRGSGERRRTEHLVLRRSGPQGRGHQRRADRGDTDKGYVKRRDSAQRRSPKTAKLPPVYKGGSFALCVKELKKKRPQKVFPAAQETPGRGGITARRCR